MALSKESEVWQPAGDEGEINLTEEERAVLTDYLESSKEGQKEEEVVIEISRDEFFLQLDEAEDNWINRVLSVQERINYAQDKMDEAQGKLNLIRIAKYRVLRSEGMNLKVRFFEEGNRLFFEAELKRPAGFQK